MVNSMTGYGTASLQENEDSVGVDVRTGNHRFLDLHLRLAREYGYLESEIYQMVRDTLRRGRVDISVTVQAAVPAECLINVDAARSYLEAAAQLREALQLEDSMDLRTLLTMPGVLQNQNAPSGGPSGGDGELKKLILGAVREALDAVAGMRKQEGEALEGEIRGYLKNIGDAVAAVRSLMPDVIIEYRQRLDERLKNILPQVALDPQRLAQEVALLAEKSDISEELARLESHLDQCAGVLAVGSEAGKKMDFLLQEMHREINTVLSKAGHLEVTRRGIAVKADIEKLREQVQNLE